MTMLSRSQASVLNANTFPKKMRTLGVTALVMAALVMFAPHAHAADGLAHKDKSFLTNAAESGNTEVNASQLALQKSNDPDVKAFAKKMIDDHSKVGSDLRILAAAKNVTVPDDPSIAQKAKILVLSKLDGHTFDQQYAKIIGVSAHKDAVSLFRKAASKAQDADVKQFAATNLPALQNHLQMAMQLKSTIDAKK